jgi:hypothetical protein
MFPPACVRDLNLLKNFKLWNQTRQPATRNSKNKNLKCQKFICNFYDTLRTRIVHSIYDLATACTTLVSNPDGAIGFYFLQNKKFNIFLGPAKRPVDRSIKTRLILREQSGKGMTMATHLQLMSKLRIIRVIPPLPYTIS